MIVVGDVLRFKLAKQDTKSNAKNESTGEKLKKFLGYFESSWQYAQNNYHERWDRNWKLYHNIRVNRSHDGIVETFIPMVNSSVNTIVASLFNSNPTVRYIPNYDDQESDTRVLNEIYTDFARRDNWVQKNKVNGRQGIITGNLCAYYEWKPDKNGGYVHKINVPVRDMIIDPHSHGYEDWNYVGRRFFASKKKLEQETIYDYESGKEVKRYSNLELVQGGSSDDSYESDKQKKDQAVGSVAPDDKDQIELIEIWTKKEVVVIANRSVLIENRENPHYALEKSLFEQRKIEHEMRKLEYEQNLQNWEANRRLVFDSTGQDMGEYNGPPIGEFDEDFDEDKAGLLPFAHGKNYEDISLPYGDGDVDIIASSQELLNELTELSIEAGLYTLYPEKTVDPKYSTWADDLDPSPGKVYMLPKDAMTWNAPPNIPSNIFNERINLKDEMREAIAISQVSKGVASTDDTTATEIKATLSRGDSRIQEKAQTLANDFFVQEADIVLKLVQLYAPDNLFIRTIKDAKVSFESVNPRQFLGEYTPMVTLDIQKKLEDAQNKEAYLQAYQMLISDPTNNLAAVKKYCLPKILTDMTQEQIEEMTATDTSRAPQAPRQQPTPTVAVPNVEQNSPEETNV